MTVFLLTIPTDHPTALQDHRSALTVIEVTDRLHVVIRMLLELELVTHEVALHHDAVQEVRPCGGDMMEVDTVADQGLLHHDPFLPGEIPTPDHPLEPAVLQDLHLPDLVLPLQ